MLKQLKSIFWVISFLCKNKDNMDKTEIVQLEYLQKYVLFIEYIIRNGEQNVKLAQIMQWIISNERLKKKVADQIKSVLNIQYNKLLRNNKKLPEWIHELFKDQVVQIELLSSDDDNDDDVEQVNNSVKICNKNVDNIERPIPMVVLKRLPNSYVEQILNSSKSFIDKTPAVLNVELVKSDIQNDPEVVNAGTKSQRKKKKEQVYFSNTDSTMTEQNTKFCIICKSKSQNLTSHFIHVHKTESYVSRLSTEIVTRLRNTITIAMPLEESGFDGNNIGTIKFRVVCPFCDSPVDDLFINFYNHFSSHTGEYAFLCNFCKLKRPYIEEIFAHKKRSKNCCSTGFSTIYVYSSKQNVINIFRCTLCNFVQLNSANITKHVVDHHGTFYGESIEKLVIAAISKGNKNVNENEYLV